MTIPLSHVEGEIERPTVTRFQFREDPAKHFTIQSSELVSEARWRANLRTQLAGSPRKSLLLFVHGYNVDFTDAIFRTAQIKYDVMPEGGVAMTYSWPSRKETVWYTRDEQAAERTAPHLATVLSSAIRASGAQQVFIIAHSMGNRVVAGALDILAQDDAVARAKVREVILAAPDIDADVFREAIAPRLLRAISHVTLYASSKDRALELSKFVHGNVRLGDTNGGVVTMPPMHSIDASAVDNDFLGHSYYGESRPVLKDIRLLLHGRQDPAQRGLVAVGEGSARYWRIR